MKKVLFVLLAFAGTILTANNASAQTTQKIGVFDIDIMARAMPGYRSVDSLVAMYEQDSLRGEYEFAVKEYNRLDSTYKSDSALKKSPTVLNYQKDQRSQIATTIIYWQQISQQKSEQRRQQLAGPMYEKILGAYDKVLKSNNYLVILKPGSYELGSKVDNVFEKVAKELKVNLPDELKSQGPQQQEDQTGAAPQQPATRAPATTRPGTRKP